MAPTASTTAAEDAAGSRRSRPVSRGSRAVPLSPSSRFVTLAGLAPQTVSRSNEPSVPLPETEDGENEGEDALGESKVKSSSTSSAALGLSIEWDVSLATLSGPRGESPGSSLETSRAGGGAMCLSGEPSETASRRGDSCMIALRANPRPGRPTRHLSGNSAALGRGTRYAAGAFRHVRSRMKLFLDPGSTVSLAAAITGNVNEVRAPITSRVPIRIPTTAHPEFGTVNGFPHASSLPNRAHLPF